MFVNSSPEAENVIGGEQGQMGRRKETEDQPFASQGSRLRLQPTIPEDGEGEPGEASLRSIGLRKGCCSLAYLFS